MDNLNENTNIKPTGAPAEAPTGAPVSGGDADGDKKGIIITIVVVIIILLVGGWYYMTQYNKPALQPEGLQQEQEQAPAADISDLDTTDAIEEDLSNIDLGDLDAEFEEIDADLDTL
jgi:hypothetical protein